jgi:acyl-CoA thioester hydrolase
MPEPGSLKAGHHRLALRVYYEDTDAAGIVYHGAYLAFAERARTEMLRGRGFDHRTLQARFGVVFTVRRCRVDYLAPARLDDLLEARTRIARVGGASLDLEQRIWRERPRPETLLAVLEVRLALLGTDLRVVRMPRPLAAALGRLGEERGARRGTSAGAGSQALRA